MTRKQVQKAKQKAEIRPDKIMEAVMWLSKHNSEWKDIDLEELKSTLSEPIIVVDNQSTEVDGYAGSNVEEEESFRIYFPDADMDTTRGGQSSATEFVRKALEAKKNGCWGKTKTEVEVEAQLSSERVQEYQDSNLMGACLLQYPFGRGGLRTETRLDDEGAVTYPTHQEYIDHLSTLSQGHFHRPLFCLILYNYLMKEWLVRTAVIRTRGAATAQSIAQKMEEEDFLDIMRQKEEKVPITSEVGKRFVKAIDAVAGAAPHSNAAAFKARKKGETIMHHFGMPSIFFTITPDDEYQVLLDIYSFTDFDKSPNNFSDVLQYSDEDLKEYTGKRQRMRIKFPGLTSWIFQAQMDFIIELVIGWDMNKGCPAARDGFFGKCEAFLGGIEEQGRTTLHAHFLIWIRLLQEARNKLHIRKVKKRKREDAEAILCTEIDRFSTCDYLTDIQRSEIKKVFACNCEKGYPQKIPELASTQQLRNLRSMEGSNADPTYLYCTDCNKKFTAEEVGFEFLTKVIGLTTLKDYPDQRVKRLKTAAMVRIQKENCYDRVSNALFEGSYNFHGHAATSCFKCKSCKKETNPVYLKNMICEECRYRLPKVPKKKTVMLGTGVDVKWYKPDGSYITREIQETAPKRSKFDVFQNQSVPAVGQSRLVYGNTNVALLQDGPGLIYTTKYSSKGTQEDDGADFNKIAKIALKASLRMQTNRKDDDAELTEEEQNKRNRQEALKRVLAVAFVLNASSVVGAPLAAYLVRNKTRFLMSHQTKWCPIGDIESLIFGNTVNQYLIRSKQSTYMTCDALDYLCRPESIQYESMSAFDFYGKVEVLRSKANEGRDTVSFTNSKVFKHPSFNEKKNEFTACVRMIKDESKQKLCQVQQYFFPDTARFGGCLSDGKIINEETETYCRRALILFKPLRSISDIRCNGPITQAYCLEAKRREGELSLEELDFIEKLMQEGSFTEAYIKEMKSRTSPVSKTKCQSFLQNIQDSAYNSLRKSSIGDELERKTEAYTVTEVEGGDKEQLLRQDEERDDEPHLEGDLLDELVGLLQQVNNSVTNRMIPKAFCTKEAKEKGRSQCGFTNLALMKPEVNAVNTGESTTTEESRDDKDSNTTRSQNGEETRDLPTPEITNGNNGSWLEVSSDTSYKFPKPKNDKRHSTAVPNRRDIMNVVFRKRTRVLRAKNRFGRNTEVIQANGTAESIVEWGTRGKLDPGQCQAFEIMTASFVLTFYNDRSCLDYTDSEHLERFELEKRKLTKLADCRARKSDQLIALMHGPGGAGKSWVIDLVLLYANEYCPFLDNFEFDKRTIVVTAMTGCAATLLNGETAHAALKLNNKKVDAKDEQEWKNTRLVIVDEISFASKDDIIKMNEKLQLLKATRSGKFGGLNIVFVGDFRQLDPVKKLPLYKDTDRLFENYVNCFLELLGQHRFEKDPEWGKLLSKFRDGSITEYDIKCLNDKIWIGRDQNEQQLRLPDNLKYATFKNDDRDSINTALFEKAVLSSSHPDFGLLVFASKVKIRDSTKKFSTLNNWSLLWNNVTENGVKIASSSKRMDPVLKLYKGMRVMLTENKDVLKGIANGTQATIEKVVLKKNESYGSTKLVGGNQRQPKTCNIKAVLAHQIDFIQLRHVNDNIKPEVFRMKPQEFTFKADLPSPMDIFDHSTESVSLKATQLPIVSNDATTGHKLQGCSVENLFVHEWCETCKNWIYVVLSRVRTISGLFSRHRIPANINLYYSIPEELIEMMQGMQNKRPNSKEVRHALISQGGTIQEEDNQQ